LKENTPSFKFFKSKSIKKIDNNITNSLMSNNQHTTNVRKLLKLYTPIEEQMRTSPQEVINSIQKALANSSIKDNLDKK
jgi:hypothetical protein